MATLYFLINIKLSKVCRIDEAWWCLFYFIKNDIAHLCREVDLNCHQTLSMVFHGVYLELF